MSEVRVLPVVLVGPEAAVREELARHRAGSSLPITTKNASEVAAMDDHPGQAMRRKKDNSIRVCFELVKRGEACGMVSAGNSGAVMAGAIFVLGRLPSVERPGIVSVLPALKGHPLLVDMGANVECKPIHLVQFALMGEVFSRRVLAAGDAHATDEIAAAAALAEPLLAPVPAGAVDAQPQHGHHEQRARAT